MSTAPVLDPAAVRALFADYSPALTRTPAELEAALHRRGYAGPLAEWLPALRAAGLREPRRGVFAEPELPAEAEVYRNETGMLAPVNYTDSSCLTGIVGPGAEVPGSTCRRTTDDAPAGNNSNGTVTEPLPVARFSYFRGGIRTAAPYATVTPRQLWEVVSGPTFAPATVRLRAEPAGSPTRAELKKSLDYVTPAGTFAPTRANDNLVAASGLLVLDFDHLPDVAAARAALLSDALLQPALVLLFASPGGEGLKALVETDPTASHLDNFRALSAYLRYHHGAAGLVPDPSGKDVARACFVCHDADAWLSPRYAA
jgi:hypothetical protein